MISYRKTLFFYPASLNKALMPNKINCLHILVRKLSEASATLDRIKQGEKFGKLAKELSIDSGSAKRDGDLGYFSRGKMVKEFETAAFNLGVGKVSEPVKTQYGYHIIKRLA
uniref:peptidylprolyl isomerase n=1 Tax=uncultured marine thaumarchaeote KM3_73_F02 TaxID=1456268 RepID=A0A075HPJ4_9ARCH|nr:parvulin-like peptidyl-prolyl isomerase (prsA) [uncultured marine thaumarchaeote KM3_73_F02]